MPDTPRFEEAIELKGARIHNLKNIDVRIPRNKLVVITGVSGSGKSSLAFDTLYAEGQRRYVESLSSYARQFLGRLDKPEVDSITGISPAIAIEQKVNSTNPRSTVGTSTEIYDYLKLLYARIGKTISPISGNQVKKHQVSDVIDCVKTIDQGNRFYLLAPLTLPENRTWQDHLKLLEQQGYARVMLNSKVYRINKLNTNDISGKHVLFLLIDRGKVLHDQAFLESMADGVQTAFYEGKGSCLLIDLDSDQKFSFSNRFELDGMSFNEPSDHFFSFNNPYGACPTCEGFGNVIGIDRDLVIPNSDLSLYDNAIAPWKTSGYAKWKRQMVQGASEEGISIHKPYHSLTEEDQEKVWNGGKNFKGIHDFFKKLEQKAYKIQNRVMLSRYRGKTTCPDCKGSRLRPETDYVKINGKSLSEIVTLPIVHLETFLGNLTLDEFESKIAGRILQEINSRISYLLRVGLSYLNLNRASNTLSGGESQRINLSTSLGSSLVGSMYILDEPSIGLHPKDENRLIGVLEQLRDLGNSVIVVEHDEDIMKRADYIIDIGPEAGSLGGEVVAKGSYAEMLELNSLTADYLNAKRNIPLPSKRRKLQKFIEFKGARANNLKNIDIQIPLNTLSVITGVSGSGKSSLVSKIIYPSLKRSIEGFPLKKTYFSELTGAYKDLKHIEYIDQNPIGKSSRSNPVTYIKAYDDIRSFFAKQSLSKARNYQAKHFSFNVDGGRCETCKGEGEVLVEMQFMADVHLVCESCDGKRFKDEILDIKVEDKNIFDVLNMTVQEAHSFFQGLGQDKLCSKLSSLLEVGLGYVKLGQSSATLSGGEAQRIKLASFLVKGNKQATSLFIFDEPTTGLHLHDINKLLKAFEALINKGHSLLVVEHHLDLIKCADYIIDLGPEGGDENGGKLLFQGSPEELIEVKESYTAQYLSPKLKA